MVPCFYVTAAGTGFGASILWVAQGRYIANCASGVNQGLFNSIFWSIYMCSNLIGTLFGAFVITKVNETIFYSILSGFAVAACLGYLLLREPDQV